MLRVLHRDGEREGVERGNTNSGVCIGTFLALFLNSDTENYKMRLFTLYFSGDVSEFGVVRRKVLFFILSLSSFSHRFGLNLEEQGRGEGLVECSLSMAEGLG